MLTSNFSDAVTANFEQVPYLIIVLAPLNPAEFALNFVIISGRRIFPQIKWWDIYLHDGKTDILQYIYIVTYITHRRLE